ncbi:MAG: hypothetical protein K5837_00725 [Candidatus Saccharibacteria bacterium]|nr:hypothetical protein [Candidatus Saccharibacteria bacterium]
MQKEISRDGSYNMETSRRGYYAAAITVSCYDHNHADGIKNFETIIDFMVGG